MLLNRPKLFRLPGEEGRGRSLFSAGGCGPQPHTGAGGQLLPGPAARAPRFDLFFRVARGAEVAGRVCAGPAGGGPRSAEPTAPPPPPRLSPVQAAPTAQAPRPRPARQPARSSTFFSSFSLAPGGTPRMSYSFVSATFAMAACPAALASRRRSGRSATQTTSGGSAGRGDGAGRRAGLNLDPAQRHDVPQGPAPGAGRGGAVGRWATVCGRWGPFLTPEGDARATAEWREADDSVRKELSLRLRPKGKKPAWNPPRVVPPGPR